MTSNVHVGVVDRRIRDKVMLLVRVGIFRRHHCDGGRGGGCAGCAGLTWGRHGNNSEGYSSRTGINSIYVGTCNTLASKSGSACTGVANQISSLPILKKKISRQMLLRSHAGSRVSIRTSQHKMPVHEASVRQLTQSVRRSRRVVTSSHIIITSVSARSSSGKIRTLLHCLLQHASA